MAKSSFFKDGGSSPTVSATIQSKVDEAAASATAAANSFNSISDELTLAQAARVGSETARDASVTAKVASEAARDTSNTKASEASTSAAAAATSASNSQTAENNASTSSTAASTSAAAALVSENNSAGSAVTASQQATISTTQAGNAASSAAAASSAQTASETARDASVVAKTASETAKTASEAARDLALGYRDTAETHKDAAAVSAATASTQAGLATTNGAAQVALATTQAGLATTNGQAQVALATTQVGLATTQAGIATTKATESSSSASNAATAQTAAEAARDQALAAFDSFDDRYLGAKTTTGGDPTQDNDGNSLVAGALFFDVTNSVMKLYTGSTWVAAYVSGGSFASLSGATFTGDVTVPNLITSGNVDGRDVSADGAKLDGISTGATAVSSLTDLSISDGTNGQALKTDGAGNFSFGDVASSTAFADVTGKPTTIAGYGITDAFDGAYGSLTGTPTIPTNTNQLTNGAGYITSADGGNATTLDGLDLHTGRNNEANKVVRTQTNGYVDFGWINTTSGATTSTISRIYASQDAYIRYVTPATFRDQVISNQTINEIYNNGWYRTYGQKGWYNQTYGGGIYMEDSTYVRTYGSKQLYVNTHIKAASNVYAYWSDDRLKTKIGNIDNALDKVQSLSGFTYTRNDVAKSHGFDGDEVEVGVSAQQVKAVLPEAIHLAPFDEKVEDDGSIVSKSGEDYMTVDYPRLVPLLIEAIKELKAEVDELKAGCCHAASD